MDYTELIQKLSEKGINDETQDYVIKYISMNQKLFGNYLDIDKVVSIILINLNYSITSVDKSRNPLSELIRIAIMQGAWYPYGNKILINPINKVLSKISSHQKTRLDSIIFHEIDHCATTEYVHIDNHDKSQYIQKYLKQHNIRNTNVFIQLINRIYEKVNGMLAVSGILDKRQEINNGINLIVLNEGITAYKQEMYDKFLGNKFHTPYETQKNVAKFIGSVIGEENLISMHFNNDYDGIRKAFNEKTRQDLNDLIEKMNKKSLIKTMLFGTLYTKYFSKKIEKYMSQYEITNPEKYENIQSKAKNLRDSLVVNLPMKSKEIDDKREAPNERIEKIEDVEH